MTRVFSRNMIEMTFFLLGELVPRFLFNNFLRENSYPELHDEIDSSLSRSTRTQISSWQKIKWLKQIFQENSYTQILLIKRTKFFIQENSYPDFIDEIDKIILQNLYTDFIYEIDNFFSRRTRTLILMHQLTYITTYIFPYHFLPNRTITINKYYL